MMGGTARVDLNSSFSTPPKIEPKPQHHIIKHTSTSLPRSHHQKKLKKTLNLVDNSSSSCQLSNTNTNNNVNKTKSTTSKSNEIVKRQSFHDVSNSTLSMFTKPVLKSLENEIDINQEAAPKVTKKIKFPHF